VTVAGEVSCWSGRERPRVVPGLDGRFLVQVAAGDRHTCAVDDEGAAWCWDAGSPTRVTGIPGTVVDIAAGGDTTCAATAGGSAYCWAVGERPARVPGIRGKVREVAVGAARACALDTDGRAVCWGAGAGDAVRLTLDRITAGGDDLCGIDRAGVGHCFGTPVELGALRDLDAGPGHACAVDHQRYVSCWGADGVPVRVEGLPRPPGAATGVRVRALDGGLRVSWRPPADLGSGPFESYWVTTADNGAGCLLAEAGASGCEIAGLRNGREYDVAVVVTTRDGLAISDFVTAAPSDVAPEPSGSAYPRSQERELQPGAGGGLPVTGLSPVVLVSIGTLLLGGGLVAMLVRRS
jgi:alpha-tubulin suppressor-like RCC1 family protein